jgi:hypothetical protein
LKCSLRMDPFRLRTTIAAEPGEYDGYPMVREARVSGMPLSVSPDRAAIGAVLCFSASISGSFAMDRGCSPQVSNAIRRWFDPADLHVMNIDFEPAARIEGDVVIRILAEGANDTASRAEGAPGEPVIHVAREGTGCLATADHLAVVSNAWLLAAPTGTLLERMIPAVGIAVLFAEDLLAGTIAIPGVSADRSQPLWSKLETLLDATGLSLRAIEPH